MADTSTESPARSGLSAEPMGKFDWERLILSLDLPPLTKLVALALAVYASRDGRDSHPGNRRLMTELSMSKSTVLRHLAVLRDDCQLIERTFTGRYAGRRGLSDTYRLVVPPDLPNRVRYLSDGPELVSPETPDKPVDNPGTGLTADTSSVAELVSENTGTGVTGDRTGVTGDTPPSSNHQADITRLLVLQSSAQVESSNGRSVKTGSSYQLERGRCPVCGRDCRLKPSGLLWIHGDRVKPCPGSEKVPAMAAS